MPATYVNDLVATALPGALAALSLGSGIGIGLGLRLKRDYVAQPTQAPSSSSRRHTGPTVWRALLAPTLLAMSVVLGVLGFFLGGLPALAIAGVARPLFPPAVTTGLPSIVVGVLGGMLAGYLGMAVIWWAARPLIRPQREILSPVEYALIAGLGLGSGVGFMTGIAYSYMGAVAVGAEVGVLSALVGILMLRSRWAAA